MIYLIILISSLNGLLNGKYDKIRAKDLISFINICTVNNQIFYIYEITFYNEMQLIVNKIRFIKP